MPTKWTAISPKDEFDTLRAAPQAAFDAMYNLSAADKALMVPYIKMWSVDTGAPAIITTEKNVITNGFFQPPQFGSSINEQFGDRPDASIENVSVKSVNAQGWKMYRTVEIHLTVHKPSAVFGKTADSPSNFTPVSDILDFRKDVIIEYGWRGPETNPLVVGVQNTAQPTDPGLPKNNTTNIKFPSKRVLRCKTTHYDFQFNASGEVKLQIQALENGELLTRDSTIFDAPSYDGIMNTKIVGKELSAYKKLGSDLSGLLNKRPGNPSSLKIPKNHIRLSDLLDKVFSEPLDRVSTNNGYKNQRYLLGNFNQYCPPATSARAGISYASNNIGDFAIELQAVTDKLGQNTTVGTTLSIENALRNITDMINDANNWAGEVTGTNYSRPEIMLQTIYEPIVPGSESSVTFQMIDRTAYVTSFVDRSELDNKQPIAKQKTPTDTTTFLDKHSLPMLDVYKIGSFVQTSNFSIENDSQMQSVYIRRQINLTHKEIAETDHRIVLAQPEIGKIALLYRSAIKGEITMLGNFCVDIMGIIWVNFGIWAYDGLFYVIQKTDNIGKDGFTTSISLIAEGSDPLGVGSPLPGPLPLAK